MHIFPSCVFLETMFEFSFSSRASVVFQRHCRKWNFLASVFSYWHGGNAFIFRCVNCLGLQGFVCCSPIWQILHNSSSKQMHVILRPSRSFLWSGFVWSYEEAADLWKLLRCCPCLVGVSNNPNASKSLPSWQYYDHRAPFFRWYIFLLDLVSCKPQWENTKRPLSLYGRFWTYSKQI